MTANLPTPLTTAYRHALAVAAATGGAISAAAFMAFGTGSKAYSPDTDTALDAEFARIPLASVVTGPELVASASLTGTLLGDRAVREIGIFTASGVLMGRKVIRPIELEPFGLIDIEITFEY